MGNQEGRTKPPCSARLMARVTKHMHRLGKETDLAIAVDAVVSTDTVASVRRYFGIPPLPPHQRPHVANVLTPHERARKSLGAHAADLGVKPDAEIARATGYSPGYVALLRRRCDIAPGDAPQRAKPDAPRRVKPGPRRTEDAVERIKERLGEHFDRLGVDMDMDIAPDVGLTRERIRQFREELGIARAPNRTLRKIRDLAKAGALGSTAVEVAEQVGVGPEHVRRYLPKSMPFAPPAPFQGEDTPATRVVVPLLAAHNNGEIAALTGFTETRIAQIRATMCIPSPRRSKRGGGHNPPTFEAIIERASCALGRDVDTLDTANISALHRKHGVSVGTLRMWRSALFNCGFFERARKNACDGRA